MSKRWLNLMEVGKLLQSKSERIARLKRPELRQHVRRCIRRLEEFEGMSFSKKSLGKLYIDIRALELILPFDDQSFAQIERSQIDLARIQREHNRRINAQGSRIRSLELWRVSAGVK